MKISLSVLDTASAVYFVSFLIIKQISYEYFQSVADLWLLSLTAGKKTTI